ncbi:MAG: ribosomal RNA small subunit methyltransferase A [Gemmatimonadetes bacterium]|nr:ribosomal RNA small subunit methyltransferase A [Gemmatimonadota bacterium]MBI2402718.1 ribosomal RNA small subunit methyltransferase A [Gemmatimonadota bacterium]
MGRRLGQHFLADPAILDRIVDALEPHPNDVVIEIGPGRGTLTWRLAPRVGRVVAIERDPRLAAALRREDVQRATYNVQRGVRVSLPRNVTVVEGDALKLHWPDLLAAQPLHVARCTLHAFKVIGNIPYYITTPLIEKALSPPLPEVIVFLVQKEVAERLAAAPGSKTYGALSAGVQAIASVERLFRVSKGAFRPPPKVDSALVRLRPLGEPLVAEPEREAWRRFLARLFSQRRKQLGHSLRALSGRTKGAVEAALMELQVEPAMRPELLAPQALVRLFRTVAR